VHSERRFDPPFLVISLRDRSLYRLGNAHGFLMVLNVYHCSPEMLVTCSLLSALRIMIIPTPQSGRYFLPSSIGGRFYTGRDVSTVLLFGVCPRSVPSLSGLDTIGLESIIPYASPPVCTFFPFLTFSLFSSPWRPPSTVFFYPRTAA